MTGRHQRNLNRIQSKQNILLNVKRGFFAKNFPKIVKLYWNHFWAEYASDKLINFWIFNILQKSFDRRHKIQKICTPFKFVTIIGFTVWFLIFINIYTLLFPLFFFLANQLKWLHTIENWGKVMKPTPWHKSSSNIFETFLFARSSSESISERLSYYYVIDVINGSRFVTTRVLNVDEYEAHEQYNFFPRKII